MKKVIFLDMDGVLNTQASMLIRPRTAFTLWQPCVAQLRRVVDATGAVLVLSSSWRLLSADVISRNMDGVLNTHFKTTFKTAQEAMNRAGWEDVPFIGCTPTLDAVTTGGIFTAKRRGEEIDAWMVDFGKDVEAYCIVDDDSDMLEHQMPCFVQTAFENGLLEHHATRMIEILGRK